MFRLFYAPCYLIGRQSEVFCSKCKLACRIYCKKLRSRILKNTSYIFGCFVYRLVNNIFSNSLNDAISTSTA